MRDPSQTRSERCLRAGGCPLPSPSVLCTEKREGPMTKLRPPLAVTAQGPMEVSGQTSSDHSRRFCGLKIQKTGGVLNRSHRAISYCQRSPSPSCASPEITSCNDIEDGTVGFKIPMLSPVITRGTQITVPLQGFDYQNVKERNFK